MLNCDKCGMIFKYNYLLKRHEERKTPCDINNNIEISFDKQIKNIEKEIEIKTKESIKLIKKCAFCDIPQSNKPNILRHQK